MKLISAIIQPHKLDDVREALTTLGVAGLTAIEVKVEVAVPDELAERAVEAIREAAATGQIGDGKIFVVELEQALRIRTGESGNEAL